MRENLYRKRTEWVSVKGIGPNISNYIYNDLNRNGIYDVNDKPLAKIAVEMTRPDKSKVIRRSNLNGFANFTHSLNPANAGKVDVKTSGTYKFEVIPPDGWEVTSNNKIQYGTYKEVADARPGIVIDKVPDPVGIAPVLTIKGIVKQKGKSNKFILCKEKVSLIAVSPTGEKVDIMINKKGEFSIDAYKGKWKLIFLSEEKEVLQTRIVNVEYVPVKMSTVIINNTEILREKKSRQLVDFENITLSTIQKIPNGIGGVNWSNLIVTHNKLYNGEGYSNGTISGEYVAYNSSGHPVTISLDKGFDFYGGYFSAAWLNESEGEILQVKAWRKDKLIVEEEYELSAIGPFWLDAHYLNITKLELSTKHYWQFVVDDIVIGVD